MRSRLQRAFHLMIVKWIILHCYYCHYQWEVRRNCGRIDSFVNQDLSTEQWAPENRRVLRWHPEVARDTSDDKALAALISTCQHSWAPLYQTAQLLKKGIGKIFPNKSETDWKHTRSSAIFLKTSKSLKGYILHMRFEAPSSSISLYVKLPKDCVALSVWSGAFHTRKLGVW